MKKSRINLYVLLCAFVLFCAPLISSAAYESPVQHGFGVEEYDRFHDVLHPLEHEALPNKDYRKIRSQAGLLVSRGKAIVNAGTPSKLTGEPREKFAKELKSFNLALNRFRTDARRASNNRLKISYSAVHDSFETLAAMLPR